MDGSVVAVAVAGLVAGAAAVAVVVIAPAAAASIGTASARERPLERSLHGPHRMWCGRERRGRLERTDGTH